MWHSRKSTILIYAILLLVAMIPLSLLPKVNAGTTFTAKATMIQNWKTLCDAHPTEASYEVVGGYYEGGSIYVFKIGNPSGGPLLFDAAMHGWEDIGTEIQYLWANWLLTNNTDESNRILDNNYVLFMPVVTGGGWYDGSPERGNANLTNGKTYGVDINRNFVTGFSYISPPGTPDYPSHGSNAADQNETKAVRYVMQTYSPKVYVTMHYGGGPWCNSYGTNTTLSNWIKTRIGEISTEYGFSFPWSLGSGSVGSGMAVGDGNAFGANSWMWEVASGKSPYGTGSGTDNYMHNAQTMSDIQTWYFPKSLPALRAMAEAVEIIGEEEGPSESGNSTIASFANTGSSDIVTTNAQRKTFYDATNQYFWAALTGTTTTYLYNSPDGLTWSSYAAIGTGPQGYLISFAYNGTSIAYAYANGISGFQYRLGTLGAGTITWAAAEQTTAMGLGTLYSPTSIAFDTNGYVYVAAPMVGDSTNRYPYVMRNSNRDGTWSNTATYPMKMNTTANSGWRCAIANLSSGKMVVEYSYPSSPAWVQTYNGVDTWAAAVRTANLVEIAWGVSLAGGYSDNVEVAYLKDVNYDIIAARLNYSTQAFTETTVVSSLGQKDCPILTYDDVNHYVYLTYAVASSDCIYTAKYNGTWQTPTLLMNETTDAITEGDYSTLDVITGFVQSYDGFMGFVYSTKASSPYTVKFVWFSNETVEEPTVYQYLTVEVAVNGEVSPIAGEHAIVEGTNQTLIATTADGYQFAAWEIDGVNQTTTYSTWFVVMDGNHTAKAYFVVNTETYTVTKAGGVPIDNITKITVLIINITKIGGVPIR